MFGPLIVLLAQGAAPVPAPAPSEEAVAQQIVAIGKTLDKWKGGVYRKDGKLTCRIEQSSGDQAVDLLRCGAMVGCYSPKADELDAIAASDASEEERLAEMKAITDEAQGCIAQAHNQGIRRLAEFRAAL